MNKIILSILLVLSLASQGWAKKTVDNDKFYQEAVAKVGKHQGHDVAPYVNASYRVANMWKDFPTKGAYQRVVRYIGWGGKESGFRPDFVHFNIPGKPYPGLKGLRVKKFSVDYGWPGLNEENVEWTYAVAHSLQTGLPLSKEEMRKLGISRKFMEKIKAKLTVPQDLYLYKIDVSTAADAKKQYLKQIKKGVDPKKIKITISYSEKAPDEMVSLLLYRTIVEYDRFLRKWPYQTWDSQAFYIAQKALERATTDTKK